MRQEIKVREYKNPKDYQKDAQKMLKDGWQIQDQDQREGHTNIGRTATKALLTGGIGLLIGGRDKSKGKIMVTYLREKK